MSKSKSYRKYAATTMAVAVAASAVAPVVAGAEEIEFSDVSKDSPHYDAIIAMAKEGIIQGDDNGKFAPYDNVYRIQVAKMLQRSLKLEVPSNANQIIRGYSDITENYTQEDRDAIAAVTAAGIFQGGTDGKFNAWTPINREQMASVIVRAFGLDQVEAGNVNINLSNVDKNHRDSVQILANLGLTDNLSDYKPADLTNREQFASFLYRTHGAVEEVGFKVADVIGLDDLNKYLQISFNQPVTKLEPSNITIRDAKSNYRYGVKEVNLASDGLSAQVELFSHEGSDEKVLEFNRDYKVTVAANSQTSEYTFNRSAYTDSRVVSIDVSNDRFTVVDERTGTSRTIKVTKEKDVNLQEILGERVTVWYNQDRELVDYEITSDSSNYDAIEFTKKDEVKLLSEDSKYDVSDDEYSDLKRNKFHLYVNGEEVARNVTEVPSEYVDKRYNFAKVGYNSAGDVEFISAYSLNEFLVVDRVEDKEIIGIAGEAEGQFDAKDATVVKDGSIISLDDIEKGDVLFFSNSANDNDGFAEVLDNSLVGEIENSYYDAVRVDGKTYKFNMDQKDVDKFGGHLGYSNAVYLNEKSELEQIDEDIADALINSGDFTLYFDRAGNLAYISGDVADVVKSTNPSILVEDVALKRDFNDVIAQIEVVNKDGDERLHQVNLNKLNTITLNGEDYKIKGSPKADKKEAKIVWDGEGKFVLSGGVDNLNETIELKEGNVVDLKFDDNDNIIEIEFFITKDGNKTGYGEHTTGDAVEAGDRYVGSKRLLDSTIVYDAKRGYDFDNSGNLIGTADIDAKDVRVTTWADYNGSDISKAYYVYNKDNEVIALVIQETSASDTVEESALLTDVLKNKDGEVEEITAFVNGQKKTYRVNDVDVDVDRGSYVVLEFDKDTDGLVENIFVDGDSKYNGHIVDDNLTVDSVLSGKRDVKLSDGETYRLVSGGLVIDATDPTDIKVKNLSDLRSDKIKEVKVLLDEKGSKFAKYFVYTTKKDSTGPEVPEQGELETYVISAYDDTSVWGENVELSPGFGEENVTKLLSEFKDFYFTDGDDLTVKVTKADMITWLEGTPEGTKIEVNEDNDFIVIDANEAQGAQDALDQAVVDAEKAKYETTATISKDVAVSTDVTGTVKALKDGETANADVNVEVTAVDVEDDSNDAVLGLAASVVTLNQQVPSTDTDNATGTVILTFTKGNVTETVTVTVTVEKQD